MTSYLLPHVNFLSTNPPSLFVSCSRWQSTWQFTLRCSLTTCSFATSRHPVDFSYALASIYTSFTVWRRLYNVSRGLPVHCHNAARNQHLSSLRHMSTQDCSMLTRYWPTQDCSMLTWYWPNDSHKFKCWGEKESLEEKEKETRDIIKGEIQVSRRTPVDRMHLIVHIAPEKNAGGQFGQLGESLFIQSK